MASNRKSSGGFLDSLKSYLWFVLLAGFVLAYLTSGSVKLTPENIIPIARNKSMAISRFYKDCFAKNFKNCTSLSTFIDEVNSENPVPVPGDSNTSVDGSDSSNTQNNDEPVMVTEAQQLQSKLNSLNVVQEYDNNIKYKRTEWKHWINVPGSSCWTTREEALYLQAVPDSVILLDKNDKETKDKSKACSIKSGKWEDPYTNEVIKDPTKTDVDHTSALAATARAGGQSWDKQKKQDFANDLDHLIVTSQKANRQKSDKTPSEWMPEDKSSWCDYSKTYINILVKYNLNISQADKDVLNNVLSTCKF